MDERLEFTASKLKIIGLLLLTVMFVGMGVALVLFVDDPEAKFWGYLCAGFFGLGFFVLPGRLKQSGPVLVFSREGIDDQRLKVGLIPWTDIDHVKLTQIQQTKFMELILFQPEMYRDKLAWNAKLFAGLNKIFNYSNFSIAFTELNPGFNTAVDYIQQYYPEKFR